MFFLFTHNIEDDHINEQWFYQDIEILAWAGNKPLDQSCYFPSDPRFNARNFRIGNSTRNRDTAFVL